MSHPGRSLPPGKIWYPLYRRLGGFQGRSGQVRKIPPPTGIRSPDHPARSESLYQLSYPAHLMMLGRQKYIRHSQLCLGPVMVSGDAIEKLKRHKLPGTDHIPAEMIKQRVEQFTVRSINLLILLGIGRNCLRSGRSQSLYLSRRRVIKQSVVIIHIYRHITVATHIQNIIQHPAVKVNSLCKGNYRGS